MSKNQQPEPVSDEALADAFEMAGYIEGRKTEVDVTLARNKAKEKNYSGLMTKLSMLSENATKQEMIPVCNGLAYFEATVTNTNRVTVLLGDNWFAERSVDQAMGVAKRRMAFISDEHKTLVEEQTNLQAQLDLILRTTQDAQMAGGMDAMFEANAAQEKQKSGGGAATATPTAKTSDGKAASGSVVEKKVANKKKTVTVVAPQDPTNGTSAALKEQIAVAHDDEEEEDLNPQAMANMGTVFGGGSTEGEEEDELEEGMMMEVLIELEAELEAAGSTDLSDEEIDGLIQLRISEKKKQIATAMNIAAGGDVDAIIPTASSIPTPPSVQVEAAQTAKKAAPTDDKPVDVKHVDPVVSSGSTLATIDDASEKTTPVAKKLVVEGKDIEESTAPRKKPTTNIPGGAAAIAAPVKKKSKFRMEEM